MKPFLKWVGGKTQILEDVFKYIPSKINNYHEIFLGGGSVLFELLSRVKSGKIEVKKVYAYDLNEALIYTYKNVQTDPDKVYKYIDRYISRYDKLTGNIIHRNPQSKKEAKTSKESYYYWLRNIYNECDKSEIKCSTLFIILNKLGFRGLYREGPNGFNVPFGHYKTTPSFSQTHLQDISRLIKDVKFHCISYDESIPRATREDDFMYLDPPYIPTTSTSFTKYNVDGFTQDNHKELFKLIKKSKSYFLLSNSDTEYIRQRFKKYNIISIQCRRAINSKDPSITAGEVLIS